MNIKEFYESAGGSYEDVLERFGTEALIKKFLIKFLDDKSFSTLEQKIQSSAQDVQEKFRACHTLKGVCLNLGLDCLCKPVIALTEVFRSGSTDNEEALFYEIKNQYENVCKNLKTLE